MPCFKRNRRWWKKTKNVTWRWKGWDIFQSYLMPRTTHYITQKNDRATIEVPLLSFFLFSLMAPFSFFFTTMEWLSSFTIMEWHSWHHFLFYNYGMALVTPLLFYYNYGVKLMTSSYCFTTITMMRFLYAQTMGLLIGLRTFIFLGGVCSILSCPKPQKQYCSPPSYL